MTHFLEYEFKERNLIFIVYLRKSEGIYRASTKDFCILGLTCDMMGFNSYFFRFSRARCGLGSLFRDLVVMAIPLGRKSSFVEHEGIFPHIR